MMIDTEKAIGNLQILRTWCAVNPRYSRGLDAGDCEKAVGWLDDALELLKAQQPRVLTVENLRNIGSVWELNTPPYLCMDINPSYRRITGFWVAWRNIYEMINGLHPTYDADNYGKIWRVWSARPTDEERKAVKWNE